MIPRLKPFLGQAELAALFRRQPRAVPHFEEAFARLFESQFALAFPYGRSALWAFFKAVGLEQAEIIMPAYTCVVVAHAIVLSGNIPRFVDITLHDYNMDLDQVAAAITARTGAIVATHLFGYPLDVNRLQDIVRQAETHYGHKIWVIQDCAHAFGARWQGQLVCPAGDVALFGLNISKTITSIFGGMLTTNDPALAERLQAWRDAHFAQPGALKAWRRRLYLLAIYPAFNEQVYGLVNWLQDETPLLNRLTKAYHLDEQVRFPPDYAEQMAAVEAQVGLAQLPKYAQIVQQREMLARYYADQLRGMPPLIMPPLVEGATYSHFVIRTPDRPATLRDLAQRGVQLGQLIEYSVPHLPAYRTYAADTDYPNSLVCSRTTINLPMHAGVTPRAREEIVQSLLGRPGRGAVKAH